MRGRTSEIQAVFDALVAAACCTSAEGIVELHVALALAQKSRHRELPGGVKFSVRTLCQDEIVICASPKTKSRYPCGAHILINHPIPTRGVLFALPLL